MSRRHSLVPSGACVLLAVLFLLPAPARAGDVNSEVEAAFTAGQGLQAKGDRGSLERAFRALDTRKDEALGSVDYWTLYARVWHGLDKGEAALKTLIDERQARDATNPVFDLVRARLAKKPGAKRAWLTSAMKRNTKDLRASVAMAVFRLDQNEEDEADELLEAILAKNATCEGALLAKARLSLSDGMPGEAIEFLDKGISKKPSARLYYLKARSLQRLAKTKNDVLPKALDASVRALGMEPNERHIKLFDELLKATGDAATAAKALKEHFARTKHPMLAALLAESAFKAGDYVGAVMGLEVGDGSDLSSAKGLAIAHARLGNTVEAQRAARKVVGMDSQGRLFAARVDLYLGDVAGVQERLGSLADEEAKRLRALAHAWAGEAEAVKKLVGKEARTGSRSGEELLIAWFQARLFEQLGPSKSATMRKHFLDARFAAGAKPLPQGGSWGTNIGTAKTDGWPARAVTWFRAPCGIWLRAGSRGSSSSINIDEDNKFTIATTINGEADCGGTKQGGSITFNSKTIARKNGELPFIEFLNNRNKALADFKPGEALLTAACAAWIDGDQAAADAACAKALKVEPGMSRLKVLRAIARALSPTGEKKADAKEAAEAVKVWTDDFELRRAVILLRAWAGDAALPEEIKALAKRELELNVRNIDSLQ